MSLRYPLPVARLLGCALLCAAVVARADVTLLLNTRSAGIDGTETIFVAGERLRLETRQGDEHSAMIFDAASDTLTMLDDEERVYLDFNRESAEQLDRVRDQQVAALQKQFEAQLAALPAEERAALERSLHADARPGSAQRRVERQGQTRTVAGFGCQVIEVYVEDDREQTHCVSGRETLGLSEAEYGTLMRMLAALERMAGQDADATLDLGGFPVQTLEFAEGDEILTQLKSIQRGPVALDRFRVPAGYRRQEPLPIH